MEITAAGIAALTVKPANKPKYALAAAITTERMVPRINAFIVNSGIFASLLGTAAAPGEVGDAIRTPFG